MHKSHRATILEALPGTVKQLISATGFNEKTVYSAVHSLHAAREAHISGWGEVLSRRPAVYAAGRGEDAPKPAKIGPAPWPDAMPIVTQALAQPNSIWAYARQQGSA